MDNITEQAVKSTLDRMSAPERAAYDAVIARFNAVMAEKNLSRYEIAQQSGIPSPTLNPWLDGTTKGSYPNTTRKVAQWLQTITDAEIAAPAQPAGIRRPDFIETRAALEVLTTLTFAQNSPAMVSIVLGTGMGKTTTAEHFAATRANVVYVPLSPESAAAGQLLAEIMDIAHIERSRGLPKLKSIGRALSGRRTLIVIDEAQFLKERAINYLRHLYDRYRIGIAFLGNEDLFRKLSVTASPEGSGQVQSRLRGRVHHIRPIEEDVRAYIDAWGITDPAIRDMLMVIGKKTGALRQVSETLESALTAARGIGGALTPELIKGAWHSRTAESLDLDGGRRK